MFPQACERHFEMLEGIQGRLSLFGVNNRFLILDSRATQIVCLVGPKICTETRLGSSPTKVFELYFVDKQKETSSRHILNAFNLNKTLQ